MKTKHLLFTKDNIEGLMKRDGRPCLKPFLSAIDKLEDEDIVEVLFNEYYEEGNVIDVEILNVNPLCCN